MSKSKIKIEFPRSRTSTQIISEATRVNEASLDKQIQWIKRAHEKTVKRLEAEIKRLEIRNKELNAEVQSLGRTNWKRKYDRLRMKIDEAGSLVMSGLYELED